MDSSTPLSGSLRKLTTANPFGASRWQSRYFVLLDSEMRYYKNEHSDTASRTVNLGDIAKVIYTSSSKQPYSFRLEPTLHAKQHQCTKNQKKIWTMACESKLEFELWVSAINHRLERRLLESHSEEESPTPEPFSTPEQMRTQPLMSLLQVLTTYEQQEMKPQLRPLIKHNQSVSCRRGVILSILDVKAIPGLDMGMLSSTTSSEDSSIFSPEMEEARDAYIVCHDSLLHKMLS